MHRTLAFLALCSAAAFAQTPTVTAVYNGYSYSTTLCPGLAAVLTRSEEHTSEFQSLRHLVCRLLLEKKWPAWAPYAPPQWRALRPSPANAASSRKTWSRRGSVLPVEFFFL